MTRWRQKLPLYQSPEANACFFLGRDTAATECEARSVYVSSPLDVNWRLILFLVLRIFFHVSKKAAFGF